MKPCSLRDVARAAGVSEMTVSRALRNHPEIAAATRARVLREARRLGYRPDPQLVRMMHYLRAARRARATETVAFVWPDALPSEIAPNPFLRLLRDHAARRADGLGFRIEEFHPAASGMTFARLNSILVHRGISGAILGPLIRHPALDIPLGWPRLCAVIIGAGHRTPPLDRVRHDHYQGVRLALEELTRAGHQRAALCLVESEIARQARAWEAGFLCHHSFPPARAATLRLVKPDFAAGPFRRWLDRVRPTALLVQNAARARFFRALAPALRRLPMVLLDWMQEDTAFAGIDQRRAAWAANAVDLVTARLLRNEQGLPESPRTILTEGVWTGRVRRAAEPAPQDSLAAPDNAG